VCGKLPIKLTCYLISGGCILKGKNHLIFAFLFFRREAMKFNDVEAAKFLGLGSAQTLRNWRFLGKGPAYCRLGRRIVYLQEDLDRFLRAGRIDPEAWREG
jgi:Helix-turn-helix domain